MVMRLINQYAGRSAHDRWTQGKQDMYDLGRNMDLVGTLMGLTPDDKKQMEFMLSGTPLGGLLQTRDNWNYMDDYLRNRGLSWSDLKYPGRENGGRGAWSGVNFVSKNLARLYR